MKNLIFALLFLIGCSKNNDTTVNRTTSGCTVDFNLVKDVTWHPVNTALADLKFDSDGTYYENTTNDGTWVLSNGCDSIHVTRAVNSFYYRVNSVTSTTMKLQNPTLGELTYTR